MSVKEEFKVVLSVFLPLFLLILFSVFAIAATFSDSTQSNFLNGTFVNTTYNGTALLLSGNNLTGIFTSRVFNVSSPARWYNISVLGATPENENFYVVDNNADVWRSQNLGNNWTLINDDYNGGVANGGTDMTSNTSKALFILHNQRLWTSVNLGVDWTETNSDYNGAESQNGATLAVKGNNIVIVEGDQDVWVSSNAGVSFSKTSTNFNGANGNVFGTVSNSSGSFFAFDRAADVWVSNDQGTNWNLVKDDYNGAAANGGEDMAVNSSGGLYIMDGQDIWVSSNQGVDWTKSNDDFNGADSENGIILHSGYRNAIFVIDAGEDAYLSQNNSINFSLTVSDLNGAGPNVFGIGSAVLPTELSFQVKNCSLSNCTGGSFVGPDGTSNTYFDFEENFNLTGLYFQYRVYFTSPVAGISPYLRNVTIGYDIINTGPNISLVYPTSGNYSSIITHLNYTVFDIDNNLDRCWYSLNGGANTTVTCGVNVTGLTSSQGNNTWRVYVNDTVGEIASSSVSFFVDSIAPNVSFVNPTEVNGSLLDRDFILINVSVSDTRFANLTVYLLNGSYNVLRTNFSTSNNLFLNYSGLEQGTYYFNASASDILGLTNVSETRQVTIDLNNAPNISITYPVEGNYSFIDSLNYTVEDLDFNLDSCWYSLNNGMVNTSVICGNNLTGLTTIQGTNVWTVYANDSYGVVAKDNISFFVDSLAPSINFTSPTESNNSILRRNFILINATVNDSTLQNMSVNLLNSSLDMVYSDSSSSNNLFVNYSGLLDGRYYFNANATDFFGLINVSQTRTVLIDTTAPSVDVQNPSSGQVIGTNLSIPLEFIVSDNGAGINSCWYTLNFGVSNISLSNCQNTTFNVSSSGQYNLSVYANDTAGNIGRDSEPFVVSVNAPSLQIISPSNGAYQRNHSAVFVYNVSHETLLSCSLLGDFSGTYGINMTVHIDDGNLNNGLNDFSLTLPDGSYRWAISCLSVGGEAATSSNLTLNVDTTSPSVNLLAPVGTYFSLTGIPLTFNVTDASPVSCSYNVTFLGIMIRSSSISNCASTNFSVDTTGGHTLNLFINDSAGNTNFGSYQFSTATPPTPSPGGSSGGSGGGGGGGAPRTYRVSASPLETLAFKQGTSRAIGIQVTNTGTLFLNNCRISAAGQHFDWFSSGQVFDLVPGNAETFVLNTNVPGDAVIGEGTISFVIVCDEINTEIPIAYSVSSSEFTFEVIDYRRDGANLEIDYVIEEKSGVASTVNLEYTLRNAAGLHLVSGQLALELPALGSREDSFSFELPKDSFGEFTLALGLESESDFLSLEEPIILPYTSGFTGFVISEANRRTLTFLGILVLVGILSFFAYKVISKHRKLSIHPTEKRFIKLNLQ